MIGVSQLGSQAVTLIEEVRREGRLVRTPFTLVTADHELCRTILRDNRFGVPSSANVEHLPRPLQWLMRKTDPQLPHPVEEVLRWEGPVQMSTRTATS